MTLHQIAVTIFDIIAAASILAVIAIGMGFMVLPFLYLIEWAQGKLSLTSERAPCPPDRDLPQVLMQLPIFNEPRGVVDGLLLSVASLDWPRDRLIIQLLDDSTAASTDSTAPLVAALHERGFQVEHLIRNHRVGYKAGALAAGLRSSVAPFVAILDADFRPPSDWLKSAIPQLVAHPEAGFIQSRCEFSNAETNWLTRAQSLLFDSHFVMEQGVRARAGMLFQFNGTGGIWRRQAIDGAGGWTSDTLCEDLDLTIRAALAGWKGLLSMHPPVTGLVPDKMRHWRVQQRRWASGFAQIARKLSGPLWRSRWSLTEKLQVGFLILYQAALPVIALAIVAFAADSILRGGAFPPVGKLLTVVAFLAVLVPVGMTLPPYVELKRGGMVRYFVGVCALPPLIVYLSLANARPIISAFLGRSEAFKRTPKRMAEP